ncbi:hypothetical protein [Reichenbachiella sp.]|uniref:hypothetical protein n=1 Tax=Reichenbachiella sp. TaxID=2184521 RepID=UPI003B5B72AE
MKVAFLKLFLLVVCCYCNVLFCQDPVTNSVGLDCTSTFRVVNFQLTISPFGKGVARVFPFKVVIGRHIYYRAKPKTGSSYNLEIGNLNQNTFTSYFNAFIPLVPTNFTHKGTAIIPDIDHPTHNSDLGPTHGIVKVEKQNPNALAYSTDPSPQKTVEVFFEKDKKHFYDANGNLVPNWFYYWIQSPIFTNLLRIPGINLYNINNCSFDTSPTDLVLSIEYDGFLQIQKYL